MSRRSVVVAAWLAVASTVACGTEEPQLDSEQVDVLGGVVNYSPLITDSEVRALAAMQQVELPGFDPSVLLVVIVDSFEESARRCGPGIWACSSRTHVIAPWDLSISNWPVDLDAVRINAGTFAHELCHQFYFQDGGDGDPAHTHTECFEFEAGTVVDRVSRSFTSRYGEALLERGRSIDP